MNKYFTLHTADLVVPRSEARALKADFVILTQIARSPNAGASSSAAKALKAANTIMSTFRRTPDDVEDGSLDEIIQRCRRIAWKILGPLDKKGITKLRASQAELNNVKIWATGHWQVPPRQSISTDHQSHRRCMVMAIYSNPAKDRSFLFFPNRPDKPISDLSFLSILRTAISLARETVSNSV
jgi:hypothetical protein